VAKKYDNGALSSFTFGSKKKYTPLQAADIYAYEANKRLRNPNTPDRRSLGALVPDTSRARLSYFNRDNMPGLIKTMETALRMSRLSRDWVFDG
jgi:hypothetical protein